MEKTWAETQQEALRAITGAETVKTAEILIKANDIIGMAKELNILKKAIELNEPCLLEGDTGAGKTYIVLTLARQMGKNCVRLCLNGEFGITELLGRPTLTNDKGATVTGWQDGLLIKAMKAGSWVILDEINMSLPEVLTALNSLLDDSREITLAENKGEIVKPHCDDKPNCGPGCGTDEFQVQQVLKMVNTLRKEGVNIIGLGMSQDSVKKLYPLAERVDGINQMYEAITRNLKKIIKKPTIG